MNIIVPILVSLVVGDRIYALRGENIKQMIRLYPEERAASASSKIFLRAYRMFFLILIPGLLPYFAILITLKLVGIVNWSWWWVSSSVLLIFGPSLLLVIEEVESTHKMRNMKQKAAEEDNGFSKIAEWIAERHNKNGVTLTDPRTGKDLLAGMTDEQQENYRQFKIKTSRMKQEKKENGE
jgi:hypothetical protein